MLNCMQMPLLFFQIYSEKILGALLLSLYSSPRKISINLKEHWESVTIGLFFVRIAKNVGFVWMCQRNVVVVTATLFFMCLSPVGDMVLCLYYAVGFVFHMMIVMLCRRLCGCYNVWSIPMSTWSHLGHVNKMVCNEMAREGFSIYRA